MPRELCLRCFRPRAHCYCDLLPRIDNRTLVSIVQHPRERFHPFGTARMLSLGLGRSRVVIDHNGQLRRPGSLKFSPGAALLYPGPGAPCLDSLPQGALPRELVVIDGTWHHARTLFRDIPDLQALPRVQLQPSAPSRYRIRAEPTAQCLSSLEATVQALHWLEPHTAGFAELLQAFERVIDRQIAYLQAPQNARHLKRVRPPELRKFPRALLAEAARLVVVYGELVPSGMGRERQAVQWVAQRLVSGETFECLLQPPALLPAAKWGTYLRHMQLAAEDFQTALRGEEFAQRWCAFVKPNDVVVAYNRSSIDLLSAQGLQPAQAVALKAVYFNLGRQHGSLDQIVRREKLVSTPSFVRGRAAQRMGNALGLVRFLRETLAGMQA